jgi:hypothetical protein
MKKTLVVLLILAAAGGLFAQELTFSGDVKTGVRLEADKDANSVKLWHDDAAGPQFAINGTYGADNYGLKLGFIGDASEASPFSVDSAYLWFKPLDLLKISAGKSFGDIPNVYDFATGGGPGVQFLLTPIEALTVGVTLSTPGGDFKKHELKDFFLETALGLKYTSDIFAAHLAFKLDSEADKNDAFSWDALGFPKVEIGAKKPENEMFVSAAVEVTAIENLTIDVAGKIENLNDWAEDGGARAEIHEKVGYQVSDPFNVYLKVVEVLFSHKNGPTGLNAEAGLGYKINDTYKANFTLGADNWLLPDVYGDDKGFNNGKFWFKPAVDITVSEKAAINVYYQGTIENKIYQKSEKLFKNVVQVSFAWSF